MPIKITSDFKFAALAVDVVVLTLKDGELHVLLTKNIKEPFTGFRSLPGGLVRDNESLETTIERVLKPMIEQKEMYMEQLYTFGKVDRDPRSRVVSVAYLALLPYDKVKLHPTTYEVGWLPVKNLPDLAYDHKNIVKAALDRLKGKIMYTNIIHALMPDEFTLTQLQTTYETIMERIVDKRNFRKKLLQLKLVKESKNKVKGVPNRPAQLYTFTKKELVEVEMI